MAAAAYFLLALVAAQAAFADDSVMTQLRKSQFTGFTMLMEHAGLVPEIEAAAKAGKGLTVFAPSDEALMYNTSPTLLAFLKAEENKETLREILLSHFVPEKLSPFQWEGHKETLCKHHLPLAMDAQAFYAGNVAVSQYNALVGADTAVHSVPALIIPEEIARSSRHLLEQTAVIRRSLAGGPAPAPAPAPMGVMGSTPPPPKGAFAQTVASVFTVAVAVAVATLC